MENKNYEEREFTVKIKVPTNLQVWESCDKQEEDYSAEELNKFRKKFARDVISDIGNTIDEESMKEFLESKYDDGHILCDGEVTIEDWEELDCYKVEVEVEETAGNIKKYREKTFRRIKWFKNMFYNNLDKDGKKLFDEQYKKYEGLASKNESN